VDRQRDIRLPGGDELLTFSDAVLGTDVAELDKARTALSDSLGPAAVSAASIIAASFTKTRPCRERHWNTCRAKNDGGC
jgi:hypothetical protein